MKWYNAVIGALFVIAMVVYAGTISGCGVDVTKTVTVVETVTATPSPIASAEPSVAPSPVLSEEDLAGIADFKVMFVSLKHVLALEVKAMEDAGRTGNINQFIRNGTRYKDAWVRFEREYSRSNGGDYYGGKLTRLEDRFEDAAEHVRKFGVALVRVITNGNDASINNAAQQRVWAETGVDKVGFELERLEALAGESY